VKVVYDAVCPFCGCLCDDLEITVENNRIINAKNSCAISLSKFMHHEDNRLSYSTVDGKKTDLVTAINESAKILACAKKPLIYGLSSTECEAINRSIELAEIIGGVIDSTASVCHGPTIITEQSVGEIKSTLGEIKNRADLIIFWGSNPTESHLRHLTRYSVFPTGLFTPEGRKNRVIVAVDVRKTKLSKVADLFLEIEPNKDFELISALRAIIRGVKIEAEQVSGISINVLKELAERMKKARFGVIFYGLGLTQSEMGDMNVNAAVGLVSDLNHHTKFVILPMRGHFNVAGANAVSSWLSGYPFAIDYSRGYPRYNPGEFTAVDLLERREADAALIIASDPVAHFPARAVEHLAKIPLIIIDQKVNMTTLLSRIVIPAATAGIEAEGTAYRMDGIPIRLNKIIEPVDGVLPDSEILNMIIDKIKVLKGGY